MLVWRFLLPGQLCLVLSCLSQLSSGEGAPPSEPFVNYCTTSATSGKHAHAVRQHLQQPLTAAAAPHKVP